MYNPQLDIFMAVADCGSLSKAAEKLYITPTAVMKQINTLENHIGAHLFSRTNHGVSLTEAGRQFYKDAEFIIKYSNSAIQRTKNISDKSRYTIRVGTSVLYPCKPLIDLCGKIDNIYKDFKINIVPFEDSTKNVLSVIENLGNKFDLIVGACDSVQWLSLCNFIKIDEYKECCAVPRSHPLASKKLLNIEDLYGENVIMVKEGISSAIDNLRNTLKRNHSKIHIIDTSYYDTDIFNRCEHEGNVMLTLDAWADVHPSLVTIPVNWDCSVPYGILYPSQPTENIQKFIDVIKIKLQ